MVSHSDNDALRPIAPQPRYSPEYLRRCGETLDEALGRVPAYESWRAADPGPSVDVLSRYAALPALTKADLRAHGPAGFVPGGRDMEAALASGEIELVTTSGSTGDRVTNLWYQPWWNASEEASWLLNAHARAASAGEHREAILTSPWCTGVPCEDAYLPMRERTRGRFLYLSERSDPSRWSEELMDRMIAELEAFRPLLLEANPSFLARLARHVVKRGRRVHSPALIVLTYENPSRLHYRQIERAFHAPIASSYGATETGYVFMECEAGRLHQVTESCHIDVLPLSPGHGEPGTARILVTTFGNPWRSLVRFDVGDVVRLDGSGPCPCGRNEGLVLRSIEGRTVNLTFAPDGRAVTQGAVDRAASDVPGLEEYQVVQTGEARYEARFVAGNADPRAVASALRETLAALYGPGSTVETLRVEAIVPDPPGKYRLAKTIEPLNVDALIGAAGRRVDPGVNDA